MKIPASVMCWMALAGLLRAQTPSILDLPQLDVRNADAAVVDYRGSKALKLTGKAAGESDALAMLKNLTFRNGSIEVEVAGAPAAGAGEGARGFIGIVFRAQADRSRFECIYLRPTNGRAEDQLRRNHTTQYIAFPDWPWERLRKETPGVYESYADMQPGEWTRMRIEVKGKNASLFVGGAAQPCLLIHDLKLGEREGSVALWIGPGTEGHFRNLRVTRE